MSVWGAPTPHLDYSFLFLPTDVDLTSENPKKLIPHILKFEDGEEKMENCWTGFDLQSNS